MLTPLPRKIFLAKRYIEIVTAIRECKKDGLEIPVEWLEELDDLHAYFSSIEWFPVVPDEE